MNTSTGVFPTFRVVKSDKGFSQNIYWWLFSEYALVKNKVIYNILSFVSGPQWLAKTWLIYWEKLLYVSIFVIYANFGQIYKNKSPQIVDCLKTCKNKST